MHRQVPEFGVVEGIVSSDLPNIEQYNGVPYGSIPARFRQAKLVESWPNNKWDGTKYGPICPFPKMVIGQGLTQVRLPPQHDYDMDEFKCLNLNITCPKGSTPEDGLPVMVWVHGGANVLGMGSDPTYNGGPLVNFSVEKRIPVIAVTINYRLGAFGFLASEDIREDNEASGDYGCGNYGIRDQLLAYEWVKKHINAFGGDSNRITGIGHSAGSADTHITMCSEFFSERLPFNQAILQSGVASLTVRGVKHQQAVYDKITTYLNIQAASSSKERLQALRDVPSGDLVKSYIALKTPVPSWQATVDGVFLKTYPRVSDLSLIKYDSSIKRVLLGDCSDEGLIFSRPLNEMKLNYEKVRVLAVAALGEEHTQEVLQAYSITAEQSTEQLYSNIIKLVTDAEFSQPIEAVAKSFSNGEVFYYHMAEVNPFEGINKGMAHHGVDLLFIFMTYQANLPANLAKLAETVAERWLAFVNGSQPWKPYEQKRDGSSTLMRYGPNGQHEENKESTKRAYRRLRLCERLQDKIGTFAASLRGQVVIQ